MGGWKKNLHPEPLLIKKNIQSKNDHKTIHSQILIKTSHQKRRFDKMEKSVKLSWNNLGACLVSQ
jgi:hypothetical protein